ncbi:synaptobrevin homolog YKT6 isoform X2 [Anarhichas minor]|uniref:synaptobrevin homolog YKT6 isoform X2 n=1 Tax=Anarhichas minor TaxID=65739 RepID=UPI003F73EAA6
MKLYTISIHHKGATKANLLKSAYDLSSFSFFQRSSVQEFMTFTSALIVERTSQGSRASVKEQEYLCHVYVRNDNLSAVVIADTEYPQRVCFTLLDKVLEEFSRQVDSIEWPSGNPETINYKALDIHLSKYQNPREADAMTKVQAELDETKIILHNTMESLLERGEKLDDLVAKSEHLGNQSKAFYKTMVDPDLTLQLLHTVQLRNGAIAATVFIALLLALYAVLWKCMVSPPQRKHSKLRVRVKQDVCVKTGFQV